MPLRICNSREFGYNEDIFAGDVGSSEALSMPNLNPVPLSDIGFLMARETLAIRVSGIDVTESVLEKNVKLA